jgi:hypothetical protein
VIAPPVVVAAALALVSGFAVGALVPTANGEFVQAVPSAYRARAFGVVSAGLQLLQGAAVLITGALAQRLHLPVVVGLWSIGGVMLMLSMIVTWPAARAFDEAGDRAKAMDDAIPPADEPLRVEREAPELPMPRPVRAAGPASAARSPLTGVTGAAQRRAAQPAPGTMDR